MPEFQRVRGEYGEWRTGITATRQNVENDVGEMDALAQRLGAGGLDRRQPVVENRREDFHQTHALQFYARMGYEAYGEEFMDAGIPHFRMKKRNPRRCA